MNYFQNEAASLRAELGALRSAADDAEKAKEGLRADNTRLTHRISYLEEQVAELLSRHTQVIISFISSTTFTYVNRISIIASSYFCNMVVKIYLLNFRQT